MGKPPGKKRIVIGPFPGKAPNPVHRLSELPEGASPRHLRTHALVRGTMELVRIREREKKRKG